MSSKPENTFISGVHKYVGHAHYEKMYNPYRSGTADVWYSGVSGDMWIEYKYIAKIPKKAKIVPDLSERQKDWLNNRLAEGRDVAVIVGCPDGGVIFLNGSWNEGMIPESFKSGVYSRRELGDWISSRVGAKCSTKYSKLPKLVKISIKS